MVSDYVNETEIMDRKINTRAGARSHGCTNARTRVSADARTHACMHARTRVCARARARTQLCDVNAAVANNMDPTCALMHVRDSSDFYYRPIPMSASVVKLVLRSAAVRVRS